MTRIENRTSLSASPTHEVALEAIEAGIEACHPSTVVKSSISRSGDRLRVGPTTLDLSDYEEVIVLGGGNAASQVAQALESILGPKLDGGIVITDDPAETHRVTVLPGDHPTPSERGIDSTRKLLDRAGNAGEDTLVLGVITGGGSAVMPAPAADLDRRALSETTERLLASGAPIEDVNAVRKHLSDIKGGRLAARLAPARTVAVLLSDVVGNRLDVIASGPLVPDPTTYEHAQDVISRFELSVPGAVIEHLERGAAGDRPETPKPGDSVFERVSTHVIADGMTALEAAASVVAQRGFDPLILSSRVTGEAAEAAKTHAAVANESLATGTPIEPPAAVLSGGETTVTVEGSGSGGPNQEFALSAGLALDGETVVAAVDTDGIDGASDAAGAIVDRDAIDRPQALSALEANDSGAYLRERERTIRTGPTGTNVNDLRLFLVPGSE